MTYANYVATEAGTQASRHALVIEDSEHDCEAGFAKGPERTLMLAILFDGLQSYISFVCAKSRRVKGRYREAFNWVNSPDHDYIFSFLAICEGLGIDPNFLRHGLGGACDLQVVERKRSRRHF